ncbi:MAG: 6-phosphogluconolactonase [Candidatus Peribacteraceae bacterium]|nr:6-phosphogluconolactonase [Candidatus Peribacteraceae bacterium]
MSPIISTKNDADFVARGVGFLEKAIREALSEHGCCIIGLSGGSTPKPIYEALGKEKMDWSKIWIFLVDYRYIRADDPNSNQFLLLSTQLKNAAIPESQIFFPDTSLPLQECINLYDRHLKDLLKKGAPDIVTLGMGDDGHIASLFPPLTDAAFGQAAAIHTTTDTFDVRDRISVTLPVLKKARQSIFFLKGERKKAVWDEMMASNDDEKRWPAKKIDGACVVVQ